MKLSDEENRFLEKRSRLVNAWRFVGPVLLILLAGLTMWLFLSHPMLADPFTVMSRLSSDSIPISMMSLMAGMLPVVVILCLVLTIAAVLFAFAAFSNEKKYLKIIRHESQKK